MGNVHASSPPPPLTTVPEPPSTPQEPSEPAEDGKSRLSTMEELHKKCKDIFPMPFDGARIVFNRGLSNHFQINHTATMSSMQPSASGYKFGATYVGNQIVGPGEAYPVLLGDIDPSGNLNANMLCQFHPRLRSKAVVQIQDSKVAGYQVSNDYRGDNYTASVILGNFDPVTFSGMSIFHYLQPVSPTVDLGAELAVQFGSAIPDGIISALSVAGRYTSPNNFILSGTFSPSQLHACYYQKASEQLQYGVEVDTNIKMRESYAKFGYQVDLPKMDASFKGSISSDFGITGVYEKKLAPLPLILTLSGHIVHGRNPLYRFGVGLTLG